MNVRRCSEGMTSFKRKQFGLLTPFGATPIHLLPPKSLGPLAVPQHLLLQTLLPHLLHCPLSPHLHSKGTRYHHRLIHARPIVMPFQPRFQPILSLSIIKHFPISFAHPPAPPSTMTPPRSCRQMHLHQPIRWNQPLWVQPQASLKSCQELTENPCIGPR